MDVTGKRVGKKGDDHEEDSRSLRPFHAFTTGMAVVTVVAAIA
jgi:hypothetical protein